MAETGPRDLEREDLSEVAPAWPAVFALILVVLLSIGMFGVDLIVDRKTAARTADLVDNSLRSITLASDLRRRAHDLSAARLDRRQLAKVAEQIGRDAAAYDPLATFPGELEEWSKLQGLLARLQRQQTAPVSDGTQVRIEEIEASIDRLIDINQNEAAVDTAEIRGLHRQGLVIDAVAGVITLALVMLVAFVLLRALRRQRELGRARLAILADRRRDLEAFAGRVAHDLRGPLSPLRGYADLLALDQSPRIRDLGYRVARVTDRMAKVIEELLALSVSGHPARGQTAVAPVVRELVEDLRPELEDATVTLVLEDCTASCSEGALAQIVTNLVTNAVKYHSPKRPLAISISSACKADHVELVVADNGIGMDAETTAHVFEPFFRAKAAANAEGHGLGLSIVKRTVEALDGSCALASAPDQGTTVTVRIPAA